MRAHALTRAHTHTRTCAHTLWGVATGAATAKG